MSAIPNGGLESYPAHEAFFGEVMGSHGVLSSSIGLSQANRLAARLDLPGQLPPGSTFESFVTGFPFEDQFVFARVTLDAQAKRPGMVFAHALLLRPSDAADLASVRPIFTRLLSRRPEDISAVPTSVGCAGDPAPSPACLLTVAESLVAGDQQPTVIADVSAIEQIVAGLWPHLPRFLRSRFSFGLAFAPEDVSEFRPDLVGTPVAMASRWRNVIISTAVSERTASPGARFLVGDAPPEFVTLMGEVGIEIEAFSSLSKLNLLWARWTAQPPSFSATLAAARHICNFQPSSDKGAGLKATVIGRLSEELSTVDDLLQLRNFETIAFANAAPLWTSASRVMRDEVTRIPATANALRLIEAAAQPSVLPEWQGSFEASLLGIPSDRHRGLAHVVWALLAQRPTLVGWFATLCPPPRDFDVIMAEALSEVSGCPALDVGSRLLLDAQWPAADAELFLRYKDQNVSAALLEICRRSFEPADAAVDRLLGKMTGSEIIGAAIETPLRRVQEKAINCIAERPDLLAEADLVNSRVQDLWVGALSKNEGAWAIGQNAEARWFDLLTGVLQISSFVRPELFTRLATTPLANLLNYPHRAQIWAALPTTNVDQYLLATAYAWISRINGSGIASAGLVEERLGRMIGSFNCSAFLEAELHKAPIPRALAVFSAVPWIAEISFERHFFSAIASRQVLQSDAEEAGRLLLNRGWRKTIRALFRANLSRQDLRPLFKVCAGELSLLDRLVYGLSEPTNDELYTLLIEVAISLYPGGPTSHGIWETAGGDEADIVLITRGRDQWSDAIAHIRRGARPRAHALIQAMLEEYPHNETLKYLYRQGLY